MGIESSSDMEMPIIRTDKVHGLGRGVAARGGGRRQRLLLRPHGEPPQHGAEEEEEGVLVADVRRVELRLARRLGGVGEGRERRGAAEEACARENNTQGGKPRQKSVVASAWMCARERSVAAVCAQSQADIPPHTHRTSTAASRSCTRTPAGPAPQGGTPAAAPRRRRRERRRRPGGTARPRRRSGRRGARGRPRWRGSGAASPPVIRCG